MTSDADLTEALASDDPAAAVEALRRAGEHRPFFAALDAFLLTYGPRAEAWSIDAPTWNERGPGFWCQLRQLARPNAAHPDDIFVSAVDRREALVAEIGVRLAGDPDTLARFYRRIDRLADYVPVREGRAMWQLIAVGSLRRALLRRGEALAVEGHLDATADVLYALSDEIDRPPVDLRTRVEQRRAEHERWRGMNPPLVVGGDDSHAEPVAAGGVLTGVPASRGVATAIARVIHRLEDADRLGPGEILVCPMTAPPWTPLFALAAAVVTDSGEIGSHPAIAAREFGIPCVVGPGRATSVIPDGAKVTVDGVAGTVALLG